jgi:hypothetical protein
MQPQPTDPDPETLRRLYEVENLSGPEIAQQFGISYDRLLRLMRHAEIPRRSGQRRRPRIERACPTCARTFEVPPWEARRGGGVFCSRECWTPQPSDPERAQAAADALSAARRGPGNPNFRHGAYAGSRGRRTMFSLPLKDEHKCRVCGATDGLHLHHAVPRALSEDGRNDLSNGIPLCNSCHMSWHRGGRPIYRDVFTATEWRTVQRLAPSTAWLDNRYPTRPNGTR